MGEGIVLTRAGHYFDAGNGGCSSAQIVDVTTPAGDLVAITAWHHDGASFSRTSVPVEPSPSTEASHNSFHLSRDCPWGR